VVVGNVTLDDPLNMGLLSGNRIVNKYNYFILTTSFITPVGGRIRLAISVLTTEAWVRLQVCPCASGFG
jgi:hypothetical protein